MPIPLFTNNAATALAVAITPTDTVLQITAGTGSEFPSPTGGNYFMLTLVQINNPEVSEIVKCINRTGDYLTVERGQENTQPQIFNISDNVQLRITAQSLNLFAQGGGGGGGGTAATQVAEFTATQGQTVFTIPFSYVPDNYNLAVFVNGSKQIIDVNYSESSSTSITFFTGLNVGDLVEVVYNLPIAAGQIDASNILYDEGGVGAVESTVQKKLQESVSVKDFGAVGDGIADDTAAIQAAINTGISLYFPQPTSFYKVTTPIIITVPFTAGLYQVFDTSGNVKFGLQSVVEVYPEWWGAKPESDAGAFDSTTAIQCAIDSTTLLNASTAFNQGTTLRVPVKFSMGVYYTNNLTIAHPIRILGSGMKNTMIKTINISTNLITITAPQPIEIYDISFGVQDGLGPMTAGSFLLINPSSASNEFSKIVRTAFNNCSNALVCNSAMFIIIDSCYFNAYTGSAIVISNNLLPDGGDSIITNCTFNNGSGTAIVQSSSGGLRITNNKFLGGDYGYHGIFDSGYTNRTGQLIISDNSFDQCNIANIAFSKLTDSVFTIVVIEDNIIVPSPNCFGVLINAYTGQTFLYQITIGGNIFYLKNNAVGIHLASCDGVSIHPNHYFSDGSDTTTGVVFSNGGPIANVLIHPQSFNRQTTLFSGSQTNVSFITGKYQTYAGNPNNNVTPNYIGEELLDTTNSKWYKSYGLVGNQWAALN